jgi:hypothetical protein
MRMRIRIQQLKLMRIHADPDPKPCILKASLFLTRGQKGTISRIRNTAVQRRYRNLKSGYGRKVTDPGYGTFLTLGSGVKILDLDPVHHIYKSSETSFNV